VEDGVAQPLMSGIAHDNNRGFAAALCARRDPGQGPVRGIIAAAERPGRLGEQNGQGDPTNPGQEPEDGSISHRSVFALAQRLGAFEQNVMVPFRQATMERIRRELPSPTVLELAGRAHMSNGVERPDELGAAVRDLLRGQATH
jgi:hypothetical protein